MFLQGLSNAPSNKCQIDPEHRFSRRQLHRLVPSFLGELEDVAMKLPYLAQCRVSVGFAAKQTLQATALVHDVYISLTAGVSRKLPASQLPCSQQLREVRSAIRQQLY